MSNLRIYMAVAILHPSVGGIQKQALLLSRSICEKGYHVTIITLRYDRAWPAREEIEGISVIRVAGGLLGGRERLPRPFQKLAYLMAMIVLGWTFWQHRQRYDILHVYQFNLLALVSGMVCLVTGKPMIVAVRCTDSGISPQAYKKASLVAGSLDPTAPWLRIKGHNRDNSDLGELERLGKPIALCTYALLRCIRAATVILSSQMKDYLISHNCQMPEIHLIPNGVDITRFTPDRAASSIEERSQVVVCVARLCYQKGIDVLLQACHLVLPQSPQMRLIIVGDGPLHLQLERMAQELHIIGSVEFTGMQNDVAAQFHRGGLAVFPSRWEGMPNALLEAMACGLPCIATCVSGSEDIIQHGVNGLLVEPEDYQTMAHALLSLLCNPTLLQEYGRAARATIEERYSLECITDMYAELYESIYTRWHIREEIQPPEIYQLPS